jgi:hypothetical protein
LAGDVGFHEEKLNPPSCAEMEGQRELTVVADAAAGLWEAARLNCRERNGCDRSPPRESARPQRELDPAVSLWWH